MLTYPLYLASPLGMEMSLSYGTTLLQVARKVGGTANMSTR